MKVLLSSRFRDEEVKKIRELGYDVEFITKELIAEDKVSKDAEIICGSNGLEDLNFNEMKNLELILLTSIGVDYMPLKELEDMGVTMTNNRGAYSKPMGEWIVFNMLEIAKENRHFVEAQRDRSWSKNYNIKTLFNKTVLFLGTGTIAIEGAKRLQGFDMEVIGFNTREREVPYFNRVVTLDNLKEEMQKADYVVAVLPSTEDTVKFLDEEKISWLKDGAAIINISRGNVIDEDALISALNSGKISAAALDVFEVEPLPKGSPLWKMDNVYLFPHNSYSSEHTIENQFAIIYENLKRYRDKRELINVINYKKGY